MHCETAHEYQSRPGVVLGTSWGMSPERERERREIEREREGMERERKRER